ATAECVCAQNVAHPILHRTQSCRFAHLSPATSVFAQPYVTRLNRVSGRPMRAAHPPLATAGVANHFRSPFAAIRHRSDLDLRIRNYIANSERDIFRNLPGAERALEFIR